MLETAGPKLLILEDAAAKLGQFVVEVVFVGGATLGLHITDRNAAPARGTDDVDVIAEIASYVDYIAFSEKLRKIGFIEDSRPSAPMCRWLHGELILDVMPIEKSLLGPSNRWYKDALEQAQTVTLPSGQSIRVISAAYFLGTKIEAFQGRGNRDYYSSRDLDDFVAVVDGRTSILDEVGFVAPDLRAYLAEAARLLLAEPNFLDALPGYLLPDEGNQQRLPLLLNRLKILSRL